VLAYDYSSRKERRRVCGLRLPPAAGGQPLHPSILQRDGMLEGGGVCLVASPLTCQTPPQTVLCHWGRGCAAARVPGASLPTRPARDRPRGRGSRRSDRSTRLGRSPDGAV